MIPVSTSRNSVTVFVKPIGQGYTAETVRSDGYATTAIEAARRAGARFFDVPTSEIHVMRENEHVYVARLAPKLTPSASCECAILLCAALSTLLAYAGLAALLYLALR